MPRGRPPRTGGYKLPEEHRLKIQNSNILSYLIKHIEGKREMSSTQVTAAIALLKKVLPDLAAVQVGADAEQPVRMVISWDWEGSSEALPSKYLTHHDGSSSPTTSGLIGGPRLSLIDGPKRSLP